MARPEIIVVGGGPVGAVAARTAASAGARVLLLERRHRDAPSSSCAGLISPRTLTALGVSRETVLRSIHGVEVHGPCGRCVRLQGEEAKGIVVDRPGVERELIERAEDAGVDVRFGHDVQHVRPRSVDLLVHRTSVSLRADFVLLATGAESGLPGTVGFATPPCQLISSQALVRTEVDRPDLVRAYVGRTIAPGFFAWGVPGEPGHVRVGLATRVGVPPRLHLDHLLEERFPDGRIIERTGGRIAFGSVSPIVRDGILVVGDAAGQVKPISGGGLYIGSLCARIAGHLAARGADLSPYEGWCNRAVGKELRFGMAARGLLDALSDEALGDALDALDHPELLAFLVRVGDIDRLRRIPRALARQPRLWKRLLPFIGLLESFLADRTGSAPVASTLSAFL